MCSSQSVGWEQMLRERGRSFNECSCPAGADCLESLPREDKPGFCSLPVEVHPDCFGCVIDTLKLLKH